jgi:preprotein translocase subunit SecE
MAIIKEDEKKKDEDAPEQDSSADEAVAGGAGADPGVDASSVAKEEESDDAEATAEDAAEGKKLAERVDEAVGVAAPTHLGTARFVFAAYFAGAIGIAFMASKLIGFGWYKLSNYKPSIGEPQDHEAIIMLASAFIGAIAAVYYWRRTRARQLAEEVATEMTKVTWPSRTEVTNGTTVVIITTVVSTIFFALMDSFWKYVTNLVYGT